MNIKGEQSHEIVEQALTVLENLEAVVRAGVRQYGDRAGILPSSACVSATCCNGIGLQLRPGQYGVGMVFAA